MVPASFCKCRTVFDFPGMIDRRIGPVSCRIIITLSFLLLSPSFLSAASAAITPERDVVITDTSKDPEWKLLWDEARELTRQEKFVEAARSYSRLLSLKKNIEEAAWEYCLVLITLSDWDQASILLEDLLEGDSRRPEYLLNAGLVALKKHEYARASTYYGLVYQNKSTLEGTQEVEALTGLIAALRGQGKDEAAYPLMEELIKYRSDDALLLHQLATHAVKSGRREKARLYYGKLVVQDKVEDQVLLEAAELFDRLGQETDVVRRSSAGAIPGGSDTGPSLAFGRSASIPGTSDTRPSLAFVCWEKYLQRYPDYLPFQEKIANYFITRGKKEAALPHLLILLDQDDQRDELLLQIGSIYLFDLQRPDKALSYYEEYFRRHPQKQAIGKEIARMQGMLAHELLSRVKHDGALPVWKELEQITPNRLAIYSSMAQLLEKRGNTKELREVLGVLHQYTPANREVILRLAELFLEQKDTDQAEYFLGLLPQEGPQETRTLLLRGRLADQRGILGQALVWYDQYLETVPDDLSIRQRSMELSAQLGLIGQYEQYYQLTRQAAGSELERLKIDLQYAGVLLANGLATRAKTVYQQLIESGKGSAGFLAETRQGVAAALYREGGIFEAEQALRQMLVEGVAVDAALRKLVEFSLESKESDLAWRWLSILSAQPGYSDVPLSCRDEEKNLTLLRARVLAASGKLGKAIEDVLEYREYLVQHCLPDTGIRYQADILLSRLYLQNKQYEKGQELIALILKEHPLDLESLIIGQRLEAGRSGQLPGDRLDEVLGKNLGNRFPSLIQAAELERKYGAAEAALRHVRMALNQVPESASARALEADLLREQGSLEASFSSLQTLAADYPDELSFARKSLEVEFKRASFREIIEKLAPARLVDIGKVIMTFPDTSHLAVWQKLILARALWAERQWVAAVAVYDSVLQPSVERLFTEKVEEKKIQIVLPPPKQSLWNVITFTHPAEPDRLTVVMDPAFVMTQRGQPGGRIGAELYAAYRWQQLVARELSARRALAQGDYSQAMKEYQEVVIKDPSPESLFDLAGIYSRLGLLGKEALLYAEIERENPDYPELAESVQRNALKRQPKGMVDFGYSSLSGRNGYLDIQQTRGGVSGWVLPTLRQELDVSLSTIHAISEETDQALWRNRFLAEYSFYPHYNVDFITRIGADKPDEEYDHAHYDVTPLYHLEMRGRIGDELHGFVSLSQDVVDDTVQALEQGIRKRDLDGGVRVDILPRLFCGGEYLFREYSDANHQNRYYVWASYILHSEPTLLQITYGQELLNNAEGNRGRDFSFENGFVPGDHPYWSPKEYWQNLVSVHFKHQLAADVLGRSAPTYYTLDYSFGYEDGGYDSHTFGGKLFLEMSRHFLLSSSLDMIQGGEVIRKDVALSLVYRW